MIEKILLPWTVLGILGALLSSCTLADPSRARISFQIQRSAEISLQERFRLPAASAASLPTNALGFGCVALNVTGPGIPSFFVNDPDYANSQNASALGQEHCTYPGVTSGFVSPKSGGVLEVEVPTGPARLVQLLAIQSDVECPKTTLGQFAAENRIAEQDLGIYEIGRGITDLFFDQELVIRASFDPSHPKDITDCGPGPLPSSAPSGLGLTSISPASGATSGGTLLTLYGSGFSADMSVSIGNASCSGLLLVSNTEAKCTVGAQSAGVASVNISKLGGYSSSLNGAFRFGVSFDQTTVTLIASAAKQFSIQGGTPPFTYSYSVPYYGTFDTNTLIYQAPSWATAESITVTDINGDSSTASITVFGSPWLSVSPGEVRVGKSITANASGGQPPYTVTLNSGAGTFDAATLTYTAPLSPEIAVLQITDSLGQSNTVNITVRGSFELDPGFGYLGQGSIYLPGSTGSGESVLGLALDSLGRILLGGWEKRCCIAGYYDRFAGGRLTSSGIMDTTFGPASSGGVSTELFSNHSHGLAMAVDSFDRLLVAGYSDPTGSQAEMTLLRYDSSGNLDASFNSGAAATAGLTSGHNKGHAVTARADGKIIVGGYYDYFSGSYTYKWALAAYNPDGTLDAGFGNLSGKWLGNFGTLHDAIFGLTSDASNDIYAVGHTTPLGTQKFAVMKFTSAGALSTPFNSGGKIEESFPAGRARAVTLQSDGKIVVVGERDISGNLGWVIVRYNANGSPDTAFGTGGVFIFNPSSGNDIAYALHIQPDGKILVGGSMNEMTNYGVSTLIRLNSNGTLDTAFASSGLFTKDFNPDGVGNLLTGDWISGIALQDWGGPNARILLSISGEIGNSFAQFRIAALIP